MSTDDDVSKGNSLSRDLNGHKNEPEDQVSGKDLQKGTLLNRYWGILNS